MLDNNYNPNIDDADESVLEKVMSEHQSKEFSTVRPSKIIQSVLNRLRDRERDVLISRFGLRASNNTNKETLESIGGRLSITRERVRQIEKAILKKITKKHTATFKQIFKIVEDYLLIYGGLTDLDGISSHLELDKQENPELESNALRLIMLVNPKLNTLNKNSILKEGWVDTNVDVSELIDIENSIVQVLKDANKPMSEKDLLNTINKKYPNFSENTIKGALRINASLGIDNKNQWGLNSWSIIVPKRIRDKVFIILEETGKPMHFEDITRVAQEKFKSKKPVLSRTVHNELISDKRFVLVGRGIYALKSWGYKPGVVSDVIKDVLKQAGKPLHVSEIIEIVLKRRQVKRNTIIANLQDKTLFKKAGKAIYALADNI